MLTDGETLLTTEDLYGYADWSIIETSAKDFVVKERELTYHACTDQDFDTYIG